MDEKIGRPVDDLRLLLGSDHAWETLKLAFSGAATLFQLSDVRNNNFAMLRMVRPPCKRLGSVCPSNPRSQLHEGGPTGSAREHDV
jgi:hypothetical protein